MKISKFPPSNTITECIRIPRIEITKAKIKDLKPRDKFKLKSKESEFLILTPEPEDRSIGGIYGFQPDMEVEWLKKVWHDPNEDVTIKCKILK